MAVALADSVGMALSASSSFHGPLPSSFKCSGLRICLPACRSPRSSTAAGVRNRNASRNAGVVVCEQQQGTMAPVGEVTDKTWKTLVLESNLPVVVDFWAPWCGPCRMIAPLIDDIAKQYAGKIVCLKLNTDESPNTATEYGIRSIPTVMVFVGGEKKDTIIGAVPKSTLITTIEKFLVR